MRLFLRGIARGTLFLVQASCCIEGNHYCENTSTIEWIDCYCKFCIAFKTSASFSQQTLLFMHSDTIIFTLSFYRAVYSCHCAVSLSLSLTHPVCACVTVHILCERSHNGTRVISQSSCPTNRADSTSTA